MEPSTYARTHPQSGQRQTRTVDNPSDAIKLKFNGWTEVPLIVAPTPTVELTSEFDAPAMDPPDGVESGPGGTVEPIAPTGGDTAATDHALGVDSLDRAAASEPAKIGKRIRKAISSARPLAAPDLSNTDSVPVLSTPGTRKTQ